MNKRFTIALIFACGLFAGAQAKANTGVAFVHGTGHQTDALNDYWTWPFINTVRQGLPDPNNYVVVNCDFEKSAWDEAASGCLADQLYTFIKDYGIDDLVVITHSHGSNMVRWILSNPTWDNRYPTIINAIREVTAIAPSSLGTPLADAVMNGSTFETSVGWLVGYKNDGVRMQQTSWMEYYNDNWFYGTAGRPSLPKEFWAVVGTDVETAIWDSDSYCGGYNLNLGLEVTQYWLDDCSDGFLNCSSQEGAGKVWFHDKDVTVGAEPLSHNQSRRPCFGIEMTLRDDL
jgi:hypothetical protein